MKKEGKILIGILAVALFLRIWGIWSVDIQHDVALNSVRALGWFDFLAGDDQTSPIIWFGEIPSWARLSFHDHPPFVFMISHIFMGVFGQSSFSVMLPFILAGAGTAYLLYYFLKKLGKEKEGLLVAFIFSISSLSVWITRSGWLEGVEIVPITASVLFFIFFVRSQKPKFIYLWAMMAALALLSKYTALFLLPSVFVYAVLWKREIFKNKHFWLSLCMFVVMLTPIIIYNIMVFKTRGHFDAALSSMVGMHPEDFSILSRSVNTGILSNFKSVFLSLKNTSSFPFFIITITSLIVLGWDIIQKKAGVIKKFLTVNIVMIFLMFSFAGISERFLGVLVPFLSLCVGMVVFKLYRGKKENIRFKKVFIAIVAVIFGFEIFYSINTNILPSPIGVPNITYAQTQFQDYGFHDLDAFLKKEVYGDLGPRKKIQKLDDVAYSYLQGKEAIILDERADWNSRMWYVHRYQAYYDAPFVYPTDLDQLLKEGQDMFTVLQEQGVTGFWFIEAVGPAIYRKNLKDYNKLMENILSSIDDAGIIPEKVITNNLGETTFRIYHFTVK